LGCLLPLRSSSYDYGGWCSQKEFSFVLEDSQEEEKEKKAEKKTKEPSSCGG
jgi:hypothetical protein|tara:strand:- start:303 stop:458 length:156 start_codon:yes stop_codon:yes gene_type:complete